MAEVPEHLLERARQRRAALGQGGGDAGAAPAPAAEAAAPAASSEVEKAASPATPAPGGGTAAAVAEAAAPPMEITPVPAPRRSKVPAFVMPMLVLLPLWAILYAGAFGERHTEEVKTPEQLGQEIYTAQGCSGCHGAQGEGGVGPALNEVTQVFPDPAGHIAWVKGGSQSVGVGNPYGDPAAGRVAKGGMPGFANLSDAEIEAVVAYERAEFGGEAAAG